MARPLPVVILPGYYGTTLVDTAADRRTVWLTFGEIFNSGELLDTINLDTGDPGRIVSAGILEEVPIIGNWAPNVYKGIRLFLGKIGFSPEEIISFGIDWRRSIRFNVKELHDRIESIGKVNIVAHSHGGLVAREYLRQHGGERVDHLITLGTPHRGMLKTFRALVEGDDILKFSKSHVMKTARSFPSAYELLPSRMSDGLFKWNEANADPFAVNAWADSALHAKLAAARSVISALPKSLPVKTAIIFGTHLPTNVLAEGGTNRKKLKFTHKPQGDSTVPTISASGSGLTGNIERYAIPYGVHTQLFEYEAAQEVMRSFLFDQPQPHFMCRFEGMGNYRRRQKLGLAVDFRGPHGEFLPDADVRLVMSGRQYQIPRHAEGDYFLKVTMPSSSERLPYEVIASSASLNRTFTHEGELHPLNV